MSEKCPFCGSTPDYELTEYNRYNCGTWKDGKYSNRSNSCYEAEIANLKAQLADREAKLEAWRDLADIVRTMDELKAIQKLDEMGEI